MQSSRQSIWLSALAVGAAALMIAAYFMPVWWVSLTAPNYPKDAFPDGIRLHFGFTGVANGCTALPKSSHTAQETNQEDLGWRSEEGTLDKAKKSDVSALDCVHEMNTINHYVGMRPIGVGAPVERLLSRYIIAMFAVMLGGFAIGPKKPRLGVLAVGLAAVSGWMLVDLFARSVLTDFVAQYQQDAGRYFREAERIAQWGATLTTVTQGVALGLVGVMALVVFGSWRWPRFQLVLGIVPALLPVYFVVAYASWLWFFGHHMHPWGAFTLKPFMPTVFGDGKVAQFSTHSYPHTGFALLGAMTVLLVVALAKRRLELHPATKPVEKTPAPVADAGAPPATAGGKP